MYQLQSSLDLRGDASWPRGGGPLGLHKTPTPHRVRFRELGDRGTQRVKAARTERENKRRRPRRPAAGGRSPLCPRGGHQQRAQPPSSPARGHPPPTLPVILSLQELEFVFDPVTGLGHSEFKSRLPGLMGSLEPTRTTQGRGVGTSDGLHEAPCLR